MTLAQKRMAAMIMETTADDIEAHRARQAAAEAEAAAAVGGAGIPAVDGEDAAMEQSEDEDDEIQLRKQREEDERTRELERARVIQANANAAGPMKIKSDYVPKRERFSDYHRWSLSNNLCQSVPRKRLRSRLALSVVNRFLWMNSTSTCGSNYWTPSGSPKEMPWKPAKFRHRNSYGVPTLSHHSRTSLVHVSISLVPKRTRSVEKKKRKRSENVGGRERKSFGMVTRQPKSAQWTSTPSTSTSTSKSLQFTVPRVLDHKMPMQSGLVLGLLLLHLRP